MKPYYQDQYATLFHADNRDVIPSLPLVDMVLTSPPYNLGASPWPHLGHWKPGDSAGGRSKWRNGSDAANGIQYGQHSDAVPWLEYVAWQQDILTTLWSKITEHGVIFYNHKPRVIGAKLWTPLELIPTDLTLRQIVIWARSGGLNFNPTAFVSTHEWILLLAKAAFRLRSKGASGVGDVWYIPQEPSDHPAPFPLALAKRAIETVMPDCVLDPFAGRGTTLKAAKNLGVKSIGIESYEPYCEMAARWLQTEGAWLPQQDSLLPMIA